MAKTTEPAKGHRYSTPIKYKNGNGVYRTTTLHFELTPTQMADWVIDNPFDANELQASLAEMSSVEQEPDRNLTQDEIMVMLGVVRILSRISAGKPSEDGEYFIKDPNWISSYAYEGFREMLFVRPKEMVLFLQKLMSNDALSQFNTALEKVNADAAAEAEGNGTADHDEKDMTVDELREALRAREAADDTSSN